MSVSVSFTHVHLIWQLHATVGWPWVLNCPCCVLNVTSKDLQTESNAGMLHLCRPHLLVPFAEAAADGQLTHAFVGGSSLRLAGYGPNSQQRQAAGPQRGAHMQV